MARSTFKRRSTSGSVCGPEDELNTESSHARRRSNFIKQAPSDPSKRPMITLDGGGFTNTKVSRTITTIFKNMFNGSWTTWKEEKELKTPLTTSEIFELTHTKKGTGNGLHEFMKLKAELVWVSDFYFAASDTNGSGMWHLLTGVFTGRFGPLSRLFDDSVLHTQPQLDEKGLESYRDKNFAEWLEQLVCESSDDSLSHLKGLARGPLRHAWSYKGYFINGFKFHTEKYGQGRVTHNIEVCVKGACYNETEYDFYGLLEEVIKVAYRGVGRCVVILFKCKWFDAARGVRIDNKHNIVDIKYKSRLINDEPFVLASQVEQVYYAPYPSMTKDLKDWWVVVKTKSRSMYELEECENEEDVGDNADEDEFFQESETLIPTTSRSSKLSHDAEQSDEVEFLDNSDESDDDSDDIFDDSSDNESLFLNGSSWLCNFNSYAGLGTMWFGILPFGKFLFNLLVEEMSFALRNFDLEDMELESTNSGPTAKLPILKLGEYEMWAIRIK
ncbi:transposase, Ptta/En/Spm [Tanacetum coccineum]